MGSSLGQSSFTTLNFKIFQKIGPKAKFFPHHFFSCSSDFLCGIAINSGNSG